MPQQLLAAGLQVRDIYPELKNIFIGNTVMWHGKTF